MMFPKPPKKEKKPKKKLMQKTPLKQYAKLEAKTPLKQNTCLKAKKTNSVKKIRTNKRAIFSDFSKEEKEFIMKRDGARCIYCGGTTYLGIAHIFASRQKGGAGVRKNGVCLCQICHGNLDNGKDEALRESIQKFCEDYLKKIYGDIQKEDVIYDKYINNDKKVI